MNQCEWTLRAKRHEELVGSSADAFVRRMHSSQKHPVYDFLFVYYSFSPAKLKQWVPAIGEKLEVTSEQLAQYSWLQGYWFCKEGSELFLDPEKLGKRSIELAAFVVKLCQNILERPARFGCFGLHEWAMVYRLPKNEIRHQQYSLRLSEGELNRFVESQKLGCTHYDAYRFFTQKASPLNLYRPTIDARLDMEQGGCVHANMDLYKWATKLWPWVGSEIIAKAFLLALKARELDMRASPYDLTEIGFSPICIETEEGRMEYVRGQQEIAKEAEGLRKELLQAALNICQRMNKQDMKHEETG